MADGRRANAEVVQTAYRTAGGDGHRQTELPEPLWILDGKRLGSGHRSTTTRRWSRSWAGSPRPITLQDIGYPAFGAGQHVDFIMGFRNNELVSFGPRARRSRRGGRRRGAQLVGPA